MSKPCRPIETLEEAKRRVMATVKPLAPWQVEALRAALSLSAASRRPVKAGAR